MEGFRNLDWGVGGKRWGRREGESDEGRGGGGGGRVRVGRKLECAISGRGGDVGGRGTDSS